MSYSDLLRDPRWQRKRLEVLELAQFMCARCGDTTTELHVHHTYYAKGHKPWEYPAADLRCICKTCHSTVTEQTAELHRMIGAMCEDEFRINLVLGFVRAAYTWHTMSDDNVVAVESDAEAYGVGAYFGMKGVDALRVLGPDMSATIEQLLDARMADGATA